MNVQTPAATDASRVAQVRDLARGLSISMDEWEQLLGDPVMAAEVLLGVELDAFQAARLRYFWWVQNVIDSSGFSSGKTIVDFVFCQLRMLLLPDQEGGVYYPVFETGKNTFWLYYRKLRQASAVFKSQMGRLDEEGDVGDKNLSEGAACWKAYYRNGNVLYMPAPSFMKQAMTQASLRFNFLLGEEWTHVDATSTGIDDQLVGRVTRPCWNQYHPIWGNHILFTAPAKSRQHPGHRRWRRHQRRVEAGDPTYANLHYSYLDYSGRKCRTGKSFRDEYAISATIEHKRNTTEKAEWLGEGLGIWGTDGSAWFSDEALGNCVAAGRARGVWPCLSRRHWEELRGAGKF